MDVLRRLQRVGCVFALGCGLGLATAGPASAQAESGDAANIRIVQTPSQTGGLCLPQFLAMRYTTTSEAGSFRLRVIVSAPLCQRIDAVAAIYALPGKGVTWPQTLIETEQFTLRDAGVTDIVFTNNCTPVQFDVITGATPQVIAPWGPLHGPLLFPLDTNTTRQSNGCGPAPVVPEAPSALMLPISAVVLLSAAGAFVATRRRRTASA